jgi:hypothetical protein
MKGFKSRCVSLSLPLSHHHHPLKLSDQADCCTYYEQILPSIFKVLLSIFFIRFIFLMFIPCFGNLSRHYYFISSLLIAYNKLYKLYSWWNQKLKFFLWLKRLYCRNTFKMIFIFSGKSYVWFTLQCHNMSFHNMLHKYEFLCVLSPLIV